VVQYVQYPLWQDVLLLLPVAHVRSPASDSVCCTLLIVSSSSEPPSTPSTFMCSGRSRGTSTDGSCGCSPLRPTQVRQSTRSSTRSTTPSVRSSCRTASGATSEFRASCSTVIIIISSFPAYQKGNETDPSPRAGFHYARARIQAALWRRERGRPAATFPAIYPAFQFSGVMNPSPERQPRGLPPTQGGASFYQPNQPNTYVPPGPSSAPWASPTSPQPQAAQLFPVQNVSYPPRNEAATQPPQVGAATGFSPAFGQPPPHVDYPPPPYPPAHWRPPDPVPGSPPVPAAATATVEVAIRYLEAVNKAINICIDFDAM
jgi:hypothetical protein